MRYELKLHRLTFGILAAILTIFVAILMTLHPIFASESLEVIASFIVIVLAATAFGYMGMVEGVMAFQFGRQHKREFLTYLTLALFSLGCALYLAIAESASIQTVALVASPHAFLFGFAELRLARHLERHRAYKQALIMGAVVEILLGIALIVGYRLSTRNTATLLGYVATMSVLQLVPMIFFREKLHAKRETS